MLNAQEINISVIGDTCLGKIGAEIGTVGANGRGQLLQREVVVQIELRLFALLLQQSADII